MVPTRIIKIGPGGPKLIWYLATKFSYQKFWAMCVFVCMCLYHCVYEHDCVYMFCVCVCVSVCVEVLKEKLIFVVCLL